MSDALFPNKCENSIISLVACVLNSFVFRTHYNSLTQLFPPIFSVFEIPCKLTKGKTKSITSMEVIRLISSKAITYPLGAITNNKHPSTPTGRKARWLYARDWLRLLPVKGQR